MSQSRNLEISLPPHVAEKVHCCKLLAGTRTFWSDPTNHLHPLGVDFALYVEVFSYSTSLHYTLKRGMFRR